MTLVAITMTIGMLMILPAGLPRLVHADFRNCILVSVETDEGITGTSETVMKRKTLTI